MNIKKGDTVIVLAGADKGKKGKILQMFPREDKVLVEGVNTKKKHQRSNRPEQKGTIVSIDQPIHVSNVKPVK